LCEAIRCDVLQIFSSYFGIEKYGIK